MAMKLFSAQEMPKMQRTMRYPNHPFGLRTAPFGIYPFLCAPVLPGETLKAMNLQSRVVTDPIKNPLMGWWCEYYFFYVKLTDLYDRELVRQMLIDPNYNIDPIITSQGASTANVRWNYSGGAKDINWPRLCERVVVDHYFRDEDDRYTDYVMNDGATSSIPMAQIVGSNWLDSVALEDAVTALDVPVVDGADANATLDASEVQDALSKWQALKLYGLTEMSYEDYLEAQGINQPGAVQYRPELIRYVREWQYPSNTIDPANGTPRSAVSWSIKERADKSRFFPEPGFIFGVTVTRPKVYLSKLDGGLISQMNDYKSWLPSFIHQADANTTRKKIAHDAGPLQTVVTDTDGYWVDVKDLLLYGEQYVNFDRSRTDQNLISIPDATLALTHYPNAADFSSFFVTPATAYWCRHDGIVSLSIASSAKNPLVDTTPRGGVRSDQTSGGF